MSRRLTLSLLALSLLVVGCADYQADFVNDERVDTLATTSPAAAAKVQASLQEHFGNPNSLVAWGTLPIEYGEITGTVLAADGDALRVTLNTEPPGALNQVAVVLETKTPQNRTALSYNIYNNRG